MGSNRPMGRTKSFCRHWVMRREVVVGCVGVGMGFVRVRMRGVRRGSGTPFSKQRVMPSLLVYVEAPTRWNGLVGHRLLITVGALGCAVDGLYRVVF